MTMPEPPQHPDRFGPQYYKSVFGVDELKRFSMHWWSVRYYALLARRLMRGAPTRKILEVGCAHGFTLARLESEFDTVGIDVSRYAIEQARRNAPRSTVFVADICSRLPDVVARGGFGLVLAKYVFEHLPDPADAMGRVRDLLAPNGVLLFSVPDTTSPGRRLKGDDWFALKDPTHVSLLTPARWLDLVRGAGLQIERVRSDGLWDVPYLRGVPRLLQFAIFSLPTVASVLCARAVIPAGWGENLIAIARRPGGERTRS